MVVNHSPTKSNLYTSDNISPQHAEFSLCLEDIMYYSPGMLFNNILTAFSTIYFQRVDMEKFLAGED